MPIHTSILTNFETLFSCLVPEIGFIMASGSVSESMAEYTVTVQSSVAGERSSGLVEIYTLQGDPTRVGYATGIVATSMSWKFFSRRIFYPERSFFIHSLHMHLIISV